MKRILLTLTMAAMLGVGIFIGSMLSPTAQAQKPTATEVNPQGYPGTGGVYIQSYPPATYGYGYGYGMPVRWQIIPVLAPDGRNQALTLLIDTQTGDTFYLESRDGRYFWYRVSR